MLMGRPLVQRLKASMSLSLFGILCARACREKSVLGDVALHGGRLELHFSEPGLGARKSIPFSSKGVVLRSTCHFSARCWAPSCCGAQILEPPPGASRRYWPVAVQECLDTSVRRTTRNCGANPRLTHQVLTHSFPCRATFHNELVVSVARWGDRSVDTSYATDECVFPCASISCTPLGHPQDCGLGVWAGLRPQACEGLGARSRGSVQVSNERRSVCVGPLVKTRRT